MKELPSIPRIDYHNPNRKLITLIDEWWNDNYDNPPYVVLQVDRLEACKKMIINELGYGIVTNSIFTDHTDVFIKTLKDNHNQLTFRKTSIYYYWETLDNYLVKIFIDFINNMDLQQM